MIGILFFGAIALWGAISVALGSKLPNWFGIQRCRILWTGTFTVLVFFIPVADEIIAYPQMRTLCSSLKPYELVPGMNDKYAYGRTVDQAGEDVLETLWPSTVKVKRINMTYIDDITGESILSHNWFVPIRGLLGVPNGSSGGTMTLLLSSCGPAYEAYDSNGLPSRFSYLNLKKSSH